MKSFQLFSLLALATAMTVACNTGGLPKLGGSQCLADGPYTKTMGKGQTKVWGKEAGESAFPAGQYNYFVADTYYKFNGTGVVVGVHEEANKAGKMVQTMCMRDSYKIDIRSLPPTSIQGPSKLNLQGKIVNTRNFGFEIVNGSLRSKVSDGPMVENLAKAYEGAGKDSDYFLFKTDESTYYIRSYGSDANGTWQMQIGFKKQ
jgi:hypothetical protein